jgi:membrane carboxypeptidase/penicillin-binding protein
MDDGSPLGLSGAQAALPIWTAFVSRARDWGYLSGKPFPSSGSVVAVEIDPESGKRALPRCRERRTEYYARGTEPPGSCPLHRGGPWSWLKRLLGR